MQSKGICNLPTISHNPLSSPGTKKLPHKSPKIPLRPFQHIILQARPIPLPILDFDLLEVCALPVEAHEAGDEEFGAVTRSFGREGLV